MGKINACGGGRFRIERIGHIDPCTDLFRLRHSGNERNREGGSSGAFRSNNFSDSSKGQAAIQQFVDRWNPGCGHRAYRSWRWRKCRRNPVREDGFDLTSEHSGGGEFIRLVLAFISTAVYRPCIGFCAVLAHIH
jgi:hypothetical protein